MSDTATVCPECGTALVRMAPERVPSENPPPAEKGGALYCPQCKSVRPGR